jgi:hypothetical protein
MSPGNNQLETRKKVSESIKTPEAASNYQNYPPLSNLTNKPASFSTPPKKFTKAVRSLVYVSQQSNPGIKPNVAEAFQAAARHSAKEKNPTSIPGLKFSHRGANPWSRSERIAGTDIAPPENMN